MTCTTNPHRHRSTTIKRAILGVLAIIAVGGAVVGTRAGLDRLGDDETVAVEESETNVATAEVRDLTESFTATGTLQYDPSIDITSPTGGTVRAITAIGETLSNGDIIAVIDDQVVVWLDGDIPAWRGLTTGDEGADVLQLETALTALGFNTDSAVTVDEDYTSATASMVEDWQESLDTEQTGRVELGTVVFGGARTRVASAVAAVGDKVTEGSTLISLGTTSRYAALQAAPTDAATLNIGDAAEVELPNRSEIDGTIAAIDTGSDTWQITVTFADTTEFPATDVTNVEMSWTHDIANGVLTIPSSALLRLDDGTYVVDVINDDDTTTQTPVTIGITAGTRVEIINGLANGTNVISL